MDVTLFDYSPIADRPLVLSDRPDPASVAPIVVGLIGSGLPSGRYRATDLATTLATQTVSQ